MVTSASSRESDEDRAEAAPLPLEPVFAKIHRDLAFLIDGLCEVLTSCGRPEVARAIAGFADGELDLVDPAPTGLTAAYSIAFALLNAVEENAAVQQRRQREDQLGPFDEPGCWGKNLRRLQQAGVDPGHIATALGQVRVEPVLTAHPTEAKRATVLEQHRELYLLLVKRENTVWTRAESETLRGDVLAVLERLWRTGNLLLSKPTVSSEVHNVLYYLREVFPRVLPQVDTRLRQAWQACGFDPSLLDGASVMPQLRFGSWVGGDRDGHPLVTAELTRQTLEQLRADALDLVRGQLDELVRQLSLSARLQSPPSALSKRIDQLVAALGELGLSAKRRYPDEPWRQLLELIVTHLPPPPAGRHGDPQDCEVPGGRPHLDEPMYRSAGELVQDLRLLRSSLVSVGSDRLAQRDVDPVIRHVECFGFHLAALDVRMNSAFHDRAMAQLLGAAGIAAEDYAAWDEPRRLALLQAELRSPRPFAQRSRVCGAEAESVLSTYRVLEQHLRRYGPDGIGALIVSMTRQLSDLLVPYLFAREVGLARWQGDGLVCDLPVVPLFETVDDLQHSAEVMRAYLEQPVVRRSIEQQRTASGATQLVAQVMLGYSDSNKDAGILASSWYLYRAQEDISRVGRDLGLRIRFFHGRGGTISRGAGPTHRFLRALPAATLGGDLRLTEQGETIAQKYANRLTCAYNLELLLAGTLAETMLAESHPRAAPPELHGLMDELADSSRCAYRALLESEGFVQFFREATPIDAIEASRIGSRPARRTGATSLADLRAIPWVFSWNQSRYFLSGWYGVGSAFDNLRLRDAERYAWFCQHALAWPPLRYVLTNVSTSIASASVSVMRRYAELVNDAALRERILGQILDEYARTSRVLEQIFGGSLQARRPKLMQTLELRRAGLDVLHQLQISRLQRWRAQRINGNDADSTLLDDVLLTVNAIAGGLRTTG